MMERFYEELGNVGDPYEAMKITANRIGSALVASGMTVIFGFGGLPIFVIGELFLMRITFSSRGGAGSGETSSSGFSPARKGRWIGDGQIRSACPVGYLT